MAKIIRGPPAPYTSKVGQTFPHSRNESAPFQPVFSGVFLVWVRSGSAGHVHGMGYTTLPNPNQHHCRPQPRVWTRFFPIHQIPAFSKLPHKSVANHPKHSKKPRVYLGFRTGGGGWIRTTVGIASRFTVCPLWPLGNTPI